MISNEDQRVRELYKYYAAETISQEPAQPQSNGPGGQGDGTGQPSARVAPETGFQVDHATSPDTHLTALCQLAAIRLNVQRCGISLIGRHEQYILAEATRTLNLGNSLICDDPQDHVWLGLTECERYGNLCENTVGLPPAVDTDIPPCFTVLDLRESRFKEAPYVVGAPFMKFYCGTPITSPNGFNIGSFWVLDTRLVPAFTDAQKNFFGTMASLVMKHLEMTREGVERRKVMRMGQALSSFVDGKMPPTYVGNFALTNLPVNNHLSSGDLARLPQMTEESNEETSGSPSDRLLALSVIGDNENTNEHSMIESSSGVESAISETGDTETPEAGNSQDQEERDLIFGRASFLMKDGLDATGCVFLDTLVGSLAGVDPSARTKDPHLSKDRRTSSAYGIDFDDTAADNEPRRRKWSTPGLLAAGSVDNFSSAEILGFAVGNQSSLAGDPKDADLGFTPLDVAFLLELAGKYPHGTLWSFGETGTLLPLEDQYFAKQLSKGKAGSKSVPRKAQRQSEAFVLRQHFPDVRQLLFVPLYDSLGVASAGCLAFSTSSSITFSFESELTFMKSFINNVGAEISRLEAVALSSSKSDFIGSISHELRSPLHGILAAAEFLEDTQLDTYQKGLIATQVSCGKTLLQVIEHVLDYSKINSLEKDERSARRHGSNSSSETLPFGSKMQNLYAQTDLCELAEEVIEGSVAGKAHMSPDITQQDLRPRKVIGGKAHIGEPAFGFMKNVAVILDFDYQKDWIYVTQPGALRRILMNILGNALKYTAAGCIRVRLSVRDEPDTIPGAENSDVVCLTISDTGKGISRDFLRKKLFTPFNQEDHLSTGCGLGLSIVKSLVDALNGKLEVRSEQGVGTTVSVNLPLSRASRSVDTKNFSLNQELTDGRLSLPASGCTVGYVGFIVPEAVANSIIEERETKIKETIKASVSNCMVDWLKMEPIGPDRDVDTADYIVVLADERLADFIQPYVNDLGKKQPRVIALLPSEMSRKDVEAALGSTIKAFEVLSAPFGPRKMAKAVAACEKAARDWPGKMRRSFPSEENPQTVRADLVDGSDLLEAHGITNGSPAARHVSLKKAPARDFTLSDAAQILLDAPRTTTPLGMDDGDPLNAVATPFKPNVFEESFVRSPSSKRLSHHGKLHATKTHPCLLLVDDNQINLRLLETFVQKRRPNHKYDCAENGQLAVEAVKRNESGFSLIFMDLSMPVMDGLEATREIRHVEAERRKRMGDAAPPPALVVALTGLANSRDQANAFSNGVDLFMTKPVKFKEIGRLLDDRIAK